MIDMEQREQVYLTRNEAAQYLRVGMRTFDRIVAGGEVVGARVGGRRLLFRKNDLDAYVHRQFQKAAQSL